MGNENSTGKGGARGQQQQQQQQQQGAGGYQSQGYQGYQGAAPSQPAAAALPLQQGPLTAAQVLSSADGPVPYTSYSLDRRATSEEPPSPGGGIMTVHRAKGKAKVDPILERLSEIPKFDPILKSSAKTTLLSDFLASSVPTADLTLLDPRKLVDLCCYIQDYQRRVFDMVHNGQNEVSLGMKVTEARLGESVRAVAARRTESNRIAEAFGQIPSLSASLETALRGLDAVIEMTNLLSTMLPDDVAAAVGFEKAQWCRDGEAAS